MSKLLDSAILACPQCITALDANGQCQSCSSLYPLIFKNSVPFLLPQPAQSLLVWRLNLQQTIAQLNDEISELKVFIDSEQSNHKGRFKKQRAAKIEQKNFFELVLKQLGTTAAQHASLGNYQKNQSSFSYYFNIFRDWSGEALSEQENQLDRNLMRDLLSQQTDLSTTSAKKILVLGSGAGRSAAELSLLYPSCEIWAVDINPVLLFISQQILAGAQQTLPDITYAPIDEEDVVVSYTIANRLAASPRLRLACADIYALPFFDESFDLVLTPWLIDILPKPLALAVQSINRVVKTGGIWLSYGPFGFFEVDADERPARSELAALIEKDGFHLENSKTQDVPYLHNRHSTFKRNENIFAFVARKNASAKPRLAPRAHANEQKNLPKNTQWITREETLRFEADLLAIINQSTSRDEAHKKITTKWGFSESEAVDVLSRYLHNNLGVRQGT
jgi:SAM-dependent methyltransferase